MEEFDKNFWIMLIFLGTVMVGLLVYVTIFGA